MTLDGKCPTGPMEKRWTEHKAHLKLVAPANRRKHTVIVVGGAELVLSTEFQSTLASGEEG